MRRVVFLAWTLLAALTFTATAASAEKRVALVIGNSAYSKVTRLANPVNDANAMAGLLRTAGFDVVETRRDLDLTAMRRALRDFSEQARAADIALVFFAGHGIEINGSNYLIPVDAVLDRDIDVEDEAISLERVNQLIEPAKRLRLIILDACRENPFTPRMQRTMASRTVGRGLARVDVLTPDTMIAFAARAGSTAADGGGPNSPYTTALLKHLATPGLDVRLALGRVRDEVVASTGGRQEPFVYGSLGGAEIVLRPGAGTPQNSVSVVPPAFEPAAQAWTVIQNTGSIAVLEDFIRQFGQTPYGSMARARLDELKKNQLAIGVYPEPARPTPSVPIIAPPNEPLPAEVSISSDVLRLIQTHPTFANAPPISVSTYNVANTLTSSGVVNGSSTVSTSKTDMTYRWIQQNILRSDTDMQASTTHTSCPPGACTTTSRSTLVLAANGLISLGYKGVSRSSVGGTKNYTSASKLVRLDSITGSIFPMSIGNRFSYNETFQTTSTGSSDEYTQYSSCEISKKYDAKSFHPRLTGTAYLADCDYRTVYKKMTAANSKSQSKTLFFEDLGVWISVDRVSPSERLQGGSAIKGWTYRGSDILKSFALAKQ